MSTEYRPASMIDFQCLFSPRCLSSMGLTESINAATSQDSRCLTDGTDYLWAYKDSTGCALFSRYGKNNPEQIIIAIQSEFGVEIISDQDERYFDMLGDEEG